jgi:hypothetical protein
MKKLTYMQLRRIAESSFQDTNAAAMLLLAAGESREEIARIFVSDGDGITFAKQEVSQLLKGQTQETAMAWVQDNLRQILAAARMDLPEGC